jgi:dolichyl-phosphate-mannose-protein mannosyltransferase
MAFSALSLALFTFSLKEARPRRSLAFGLGAGVCLGFAGACKWSGFFLAAGLLAIRMLIALLRRWNARFEDPRPEDFYSPEAASSWNAARIFLAFCVAPFLAYSLTYIPQMLREHTLFEFVASHRTMWDIMSGTSPGHPYASLWYSWPALWRPVWYLFEIKGHDVALWTDDNPAAAVVGLVNPVVLFAGEAAVLCASWNALIRRERESMVVAVGFFSQYLPWAANPKGLEFAYYFYPSILCLGPALALVIFRRRSAWRNVAAVGFLALAAAAFAFFLPVLASGIGVSPEGLTARAWLPTWR